MDMKELGREVLRELERTVTAISAEEAERLLAAVIDARARLCRRGRPARSRGRGVCDAPHAHGAAVFSRGEDRHAGIGAAISWLFGSGSGQTASLCAMAERARLSERRSLWRPSFPLADRQNRGRRRQDSSPTPKSSSANRRHRFGPMGSLFEDEPVLFLDLLILQLMRKSFDQLGGDVQRDANLE